MKYRADMADHFNVEIAAYLLKLKAVDVKANPEVIAEATWILIIFSCFIMRLLFTLNFTLMP